MNNGPTISNDAVLSSDADPPESPLREIARRYGLSPREAEVLELWATGHGAKAIQDKLVLSPSTVTTHVRHIYEKCDVHSRAKIIALIEGARKA